uniref:hypothetical protein n=1 Tax=Candidatus Electronema sp. TaxID=2698783 RepID=UPI0040564FBF
MFMRYSVSAGLIFAGVLVISTSSYAGEFEKHGNNGTVTCNIYCGAMNGQQPKWGNKVGYCKAAVNQHTGETESCNAPPGYLPSGKELTCVCNDDVFVKHGNNGTVSCDTYCGDSKWDGVSGRCVAAWNTKTNQNKDTSCSYVPGFLNGPELTCTCRP